jgi:hypothetical protein
MILARLRLGPTRHVAPQNLTHLHRVSPHKPC